MTRAASLAAAPALSSNVRPLSAEAELDAYLRTIAGRAPGARLLEIRFALRHQGMGRVFIAAHSATGAGRFIRRLGHRTDVYVGTCLRDRAAGGRNAISSSHLVFVEIDAPDALDRLTSFPHPPTMIVASGTAGHAHAYWTLRTPVNTDMLERANRRLAQHLGADLSSADAARILRPPATRNHKHSPPGAVSLVAVDPTRRYEIDALIDILDDPAGAPPAVGECLIAGRTALDRALRAIPTAAYVYALTGRIPDRAGKISCPFHDDHTPSLQLYDDGTWYCFGACRSGGSIYDFASRVLGIDTTGPAFLRLRAQLAQRLGLRER